MNFCEALASMKENKKIRLPYYEHDVYYMGCYKSILDGPKHYSIVKMKGNDVHPDNKRYAPIFYVSDILSDDWEIYNDTK